MKIKFLLLGISLSLAPQTISAQCITPIQDCYALGYTQTSCPNGKGVKCPFGNGWYCGGTAAQDCIKLGYDKDCTGAGESGSGQTCNGKYQSCTCDSSYKYTCTGTGFSGGSGSACGGKYTSCTCADGYEWKDGACTATRPVCAVGSLYYSDNTCSTNKVSGKTLLGVVIYSNGASGGGWIMTINPIQTGIKWSTESADIPDLPNCVSRPSCIQDIQKSCIYTDIITLYGNSSKYPAAWAAKNYKPSGTPSGKFWCLPSIGLLNNINNSTRFKKINTGISTANGTLLGNIFDNTETVWSSTEGSKGGGYTLSIGDTGPSGLYDDEVWGGVLDSSSYSVRPVLEF